MNTLMIRFFHPLRNSILSISYQSYSTSLAQTRIIRNRIGLLSYHASSQYLHRDDSRKPKIVTNNSETLWNPNSAQLRKIEILTKRILYEVPVGDLTLKDLTAVRSAMSFYTREVRSMNITRHRFTLSSPEIALSKTYATNIEKLLERVLREEHKQRKAAGGKGIIRADKLMYQHVLDAVATCGMPQKAEDWLEKLHDASLWKDKRYLKPDLVAYNACLTAWARCDGIPYSGQRAESLLKKMIKNDIEPTTTSYNRVISAWGRSGGGEKAAEAAEALLEEMISNQSVIALPDKNSWHSVMEAWSWSESLHSPEKVENLIQRMFEFSNISEEGELMKPDLSTYHILLTSFAKSGRRDLVSKAEHIFDGLFSDKLHVVPNTITFTIMMEVLAKLRVKGNARKAHEILNRMIRFSQLNDNVKPNTFTFNVVIDAYAKSGEVNAADKAEELLLQLEDLYEKEKDDDLKPNIVSFTSTIDAIANTAGRNSISKAQRIYDRVKKRIIEGDKEFAASAIVHASMIKVLSKSGQYGAGEKALKILKDLYTQSCLHNGNQLKLSISLFNSVIDALKNDRAASVDDVEWVIDWMKELSSNGHIDFGPDRISYTSLIAAWSESKHTNALDMVEKILKMMENDPRLSPTTVTYAVVINALARSKAPDAPYRAEKLVNKMEILQDDPKTKVKVNTVCYTSLINAWVGSMRYQEDVALRHISSILRKMWTLHETRQYPTKPTLVTYGTVSFLLSMLVIINLFDFIFVLDY